MTPPAPVLPEEAGAQTPQSAPQDAPASAPPSAPPLAYALQQPGNRPAVESLVWGLLLFVPFLAGVMAIRRGRAGLRLAGEIGGIGSGTARAGIALGVLSLVLSTFVSVSVGPMVMARRQAARVVGCMSQMRQFAVAAMMYGNANSGAVPPDLDALGTTLGPGRLPALCTCPEAALKGATPAATLKSGAACSYVYIPPPPGVTVFAQLPNPSATVMMFEPPANHGGRGFNAVYWDGHVEWHSGPGAAALSAQLSAQAAANAAARGQAPPSTAPSAPAVPGDTGGSVR